MTDTEREALTQRIDELCQEVETLKREKAYRELDKCLQCSNVDALLKSQADNDKLRELLQRLHKEYQYMRVRPRQMYLQHEQRMRSIEDEMRELEIEV